MQLNSVWNTALIAETVSASAYIHATKNGTVTDGVTHQTALTCAYYFQSVTFVKKR